MTPFQQKYVSISYQASSGQPGHSFSLAVYLYVLHPLVALDMVGAETVRSVVTTTPRETACELVSGATPAPACPAIPSTDIAVRAVNPTSAGIRCRHFMLHSSAWE